MNIHPLCIIIGSWLLIGVIYLIYKVSILEDELYDLTDEVDKLKKEIKNEKRRSN